MASGRWYHVLTERLALFAVLTLLCASCIAYNLDSLLQRVYANQRARSAAKIRYTAEPVAPIRWASTPPPPPPDPYSVYAADVSDVLHSDWQSMKKGSIRYEECLELKRCRYRCDWKDDNAINPCFSGCLCPTPDCMVLPNLPLPPSPPGPLNRTNAGPLLLPTSKPAPFMCVRNPFYARTNVSGRQGLTCLGERTGDALPNAPLPNSSLPQHDIDVIHFKRQTATWFDNWVDWVVGPCARRPKSDVNASSMSYTYDPVLHNYTLRNVCFRSNGRIAAYQPTPVKVYVDGHFRFWGGGEKQQYFTDIEALPQPPTCFRRQKVFLSYFVMPIYNSFFTTIKAASELKFLNAVWPHAKDDVLHLRLISPHCEDFEKRGLPNTYNFFRGALSRFGWATLRQKPKPGQDAMVCFEEVSMLHTCESEMCEGPAQSGELGRTQKWKVTMEGLRNEEEERLAVHGLRDAMGLCTGVTRTVVNKTHPRLIIVDRHHGKRYANLNMVMAGIADYAFAKGFHTLHVVDQRHGIEPISLVRLHQRADVLFGHCGGGMSWLFTQPRGSVVLETVVGSCAEQYYAQWDSARVCDYGGLSMNSNVSYYTAFVSKRSRLAYDDLNIPLAYWERLIDLAHCKLLSNPDGVASTNQSACGTPTIQAWESLLSPGNPRELMLGD